MLRGGPIRLELVRERRTDAPLIGRDGEVARVVQLAQDPTTGAVLLTGPTGIGKSRLGEGILAELSRRGWKGVGLSAVDSTSGIPYASLSEVVPDVLDQLHELSPEAADLAVLRALETTLALDGPRSVVVVIEDVAATDQRSCELLVHLAANRRLFIVASQGPDRSLDEALRRLTPASVVEVAVEPLDLGATAGLAAALLGGRPGPGLVRHLHARTGGHPLFIRDLIEEARARGVVDQRDEMFCLTDDLTISPSLGRQIVFRLGLLTEGERDVLELLAVGGEIEADLTPLVNRRRHRELATLIERHGLRRADDRVIHALARGAAAMTIATDTLVEATYTALKLDRVNDASRLAATAYAAEPNEATRTARAEAMIRQGRFVEADALLAEPLRPDLGDWARLRRWIRRSSNQLWGFGDAQEAWRIDVEVLDELSDPAAVARVEAHLAWIAYCDGRAPEAVVRTEPLLDIEHPEVRFATAVTRAPALLLCGRVDEAEALAQRGWDEGWGADTEYGSHGQHLIALGYAKLYGGDLEGARVVAEQAIAACRQSSEVTPLLFFLDLAAWTELLSGELSAALSYFEEALAVATELAITSSVRSSLAGIVLCRAQLGRRDETEAAWSRLLDVPRAPGPRDSLDVELAGAWLTVTVGDPSDGAAQLRLVAARAGEQGLRALQLLALFDIARLGYLTEHDTTMATAVAERCQGRLFPFMGRAMVAMARADAAGLDAAAASAAERGLRLWAAELAGWAAEAWARAGDQRAATASQRLAADARTSVAEALTPALARTGLIDPLTRREREIATLAATGARNSEIAEQLHVSVRTVETHLHRIYRKLGVEGRGELAGALGPLG